MTANKPYYDFFLKASFWEQSGFCFKPIVSSSAPFHKPGEKTSTGSPFLQESPRTQKSLFSTGLWQWQKGLGSHATIAMATRSLVGPGMHSQAEEAAAQ